MKAWRQRRPAGSNSSARQSGQVAVSGVTTVFAVPRRLTFISKPHAPVAGASLASTAVTLASGGASVSSRAMKASMSRAAPSASMSTPSPSLRTQPARFSSCARR
jgi:hypothetical protein